MSQEAKDAQQTMSKTEIEPTQSQFSNPNEEIESHNPVVEPGKTEEQLNAVKRSNDSSISAKTIQIDLVGSRICQVILPVTLCALYVVAITRITDYNVIKSPGVLERAWNQMGIDTRDSSSLVDSVVSNLIIVGGFLALVAAISLIMLLIFYMEWFGCLNYYYYFPAFIIMSMLTPAYLQDCLMALNLFGLDIITVLLITWNFTALGMIAIFKIYTCASLYVQQFYLIHNSAILAVIFIKNLPGWAPWLLLVVLVAWDLFAVLAPMGPLNLLLDMAEREGVVEMPGLIYSTDLPADRETGTSIAKKNDAPIRDESLREVRNQEGRKLSAAKQALELNRSDEKDNSIEERGINVGLGDFIFYSLLIGLTSRGLERNNFYSTLASLQAILVGLIITLMILATKRHAMPALPISIGLGLLIVPITEYLGASFANKLASEQIFV